MKNAARSLEFERAALIRDHIIELRKQFESYGKLDTEIELSKIPVEKAAAVRLKAGRHHGKGK